MRATTVIGLTHKGGTVIGSDGQVTVGQTIMKQSARKIRKLHDGSVLAGFAGAAADAFTLFAKFEDNLGKYNGNLERAAVELAKATALVISGSGEVVEPDDGIVAIGSGGSYALAAARVLVKHTELTTKELVEESLRTAAGICVYTNDHFTIEEL
jgi:ATP-dependent HslUV protease subunit HslV